MKTNDSFENAVKRAAGWPTVQGASPNDHAIMERLMDSTLAYLLQDDAEEKIIHLLDQLEDYLNQPSDAGNPFMAPTTNRIPVMHPQSLLQYVNWVLASRSASVTEIVRSYRLLSYQILPHTLAVMTRPGYGGQPNGPYGGPTLSPGMHNTMAGMSPTGWGHMFSEDTSSWSAHQSHPAAQTSSQSGPSMKTTDNADGHGRAMDTN